MRPGPRTLCVVMSAALALAVASPLLAGQTPGILPVSQVHAGMKGVAYTIFSGDQIEKMEVEVLGVLPNVLGPKTNIIVVELKGPKVEHSGVVSGMSGSPVYIDGKLVGAVALRLGIFTKEAIAGVTPIEQMLEIEKDLPSNKGAAPNPPGPEVRALATAQIPLPADLAGRMGLGQGDSFVPIETPMVFSGLYPQTLARYRSQLTAFGLTTVEGGNVAPRPDDAQIRPGDMVGVGLIQGDISASAGCTVTAVIGDLVFVCGHPLFDFGSVQMPLIRSHVVTTLNSSLASTKILTMGGSIGTVTQDRLTGVMGRLGAGPRMIPMDVTLATPTGVKKFHFEVIQDPKLTPLLVGLATLNGVVGNTAYSEGTTLQLNGTIDLRGHSPLKLESLFAPTDVLIPDAFFLASMIQNDFGRIFTNPYEQPRVEKVSLHVTTLPERRWAAIENAWSEKSEVTPGETIHIKVLLRPYRGAPFIREVPITIPAQATRGNLRVQVSDAEILNRMDRSFSGTAQLPGLEELIKLLNRERHNDRLYVTLLQPTPTLLVEDKELPDVPLSAINVLDQRRTTGRAALLWESEVGEWSVEMNQVISGQHSLTIAVK